MRVLARVEATGPQTGALGRELFARLGRPGYRALYALASLPRTYARADIEAVCARLLEAQCISYAALRGALERRAMIPPAPEPPLTQAGPGIRAITEYQTFWEQHSCHSPHFPHASHLNAVQDIRALAAHTCACACNAILTRVGRVSSAASLHLYTTVRSNLASKNAQLDVDAPNSGAASLNKWHLACSGCPETQPGDHIASVCSKCGQPFLVEYEWRSPGRDALLNRCDMWRYTPLMPLRSGEVPISLGEGVTPLLPAPALASALGVKRLWVKDESLNPTGSFKARGLSAAVTRARGFGVKGLVVPTAGNAGAALAAYAAAARIPARVYAPRETPTTILNTIRAFDAELVLVNGHIGDAGREARAFAATSGYYDLSTLREPYRIEGKKTMGIEIAEQLGWRLPTHIVYPTGGGTGLIGMWKVFHELREVDWLPTSIPLPKMVVAQAAGCAPIVRAVQAGADRAVPWENPQTHAAGLRVPAPLGDRLILRAIRESGGAAVAATEDEIRAGMRGLSRDVGVDAAPEGGCSLAVLRHLVADGRIGADAEVVLFNTGSGWSYRN